VKKYLAIVLGMIFILGFAVTAYAMDKPEITLSGNIMVRGWYVDNNAGNVPQASESRAFYTTDATLAIDAKVSNNLRGFIELETTQGGDSSSGEYIWGYDDALHGWNQKPNSELYFRQLWIQYTGSGLLGVPSGIKVGHQLISVGEKQFLNNERFGDDAILVWTDPTKELHLAAGTAKLVENNYMRHGDDIDGYLVVATYKLDKKNTIGANWTWVHSDMSSISNADSLNFHNIGVHADGNVSGLVYAGEADFQFGNLNRIVGDDLKFRGWAVMAKLGYAIDILNIRGSFAYGSGDDDTDNKIEEFQVIQEPDTVYFISRNPHYTQIYERTIQTASQDQTLTGDLTARNTSIANTIYYNLGLDLNPVKELSLSLDGFIIRASKNQYGSKSVGTELDFKGSYQIAKNLSYFVEAGAFWPQNYYKDTWGLDKETVTQLVHGLSLTF
jgi:hypothetical protein